VNSVEVVQLDEQNIRDVYIAYYIYLDNFPKKYIYIYLDNYL